MGFLRLSVSKLIILIVISTLMYGCGSVMRGKVVTFNEGLLPMGETIRIEPMDPEKAQSLEFRSYAKLFAEELLKIGYTPVSDANVEVDLVAQVDYSIERLAAEVRVQRSRPYVRYHFNYGSYYDPFYFGFENSWNETTYTTRTYLRHLQLNIVKTDEEAGRIFEGRVESTGRQSQLPEIMPYLITAMFSNFPGESGMTKVVTIAMDE